MNHFYESIYGWSHYLVPWYKYIVPLLPDNPQVVEVGCWHGRSTACLAVELINHKQTFNLWAVDHWLGCNEPFYFQNIILEELAEDQPYKIFLKNMEPVIDQLNIIRETSVRAAEQFEDNSLDLVILDDDHVQEAVINSIMAWWPKLKPNGILCGDDHDSNYPGVINGVRNMFGSDPGSYAIYTYLGFAEIESTGVWVVQKTPDRQLLDQSLPEDFWQYKIPYKSNDHVEHESETICQDRSSKEEKIIPISRLQNPKKHSII
jgi:SAM-dependent methyltransferase